MSLKTAADGSMLFDDGTRLSMPRFQVLDPGHMIDMTMHADGGKADTFGRFFHIVTCQNIVTWMQYGRRARN